MGNPETAEKLFWIFFGFLGHDPKSQGTTEQNRTKQTNAQKQEKHTRTDKALSAEQAADFGMWQQSAAAPAR